MAVPTTITAYGWSYSDIQDITLYPGLSGHSNNTYVGAFQVDQTTATVITFTASGSGNFSLSTPVVTSGGKTSATFTITSMKGGVESVQLTLSAAVTNTLAYLLEVSSTPPGQIATNFPNFASVQTAAVAYFQSLK